jgi:hypothetical protein
LLGHAALLAQFGDVGAYALALLFFVHRC